MEIVYETHWWSIGKVGLQSALVDVAVGNFALKPHLIFVVSRRLHHYRRLYSSRRNRTLQTDNDHFLGIAQISALALTRRCLLYSMSAASPEAVVFPAARIHSLYSLQHVNN
jgi:hypothetical protein